MNPREKLDSLRREMFAYEERIKNCKHDFNDAKFDPEIVRSPYYNMCTQGVDVYYEISGYKNAQKDRWSRECKICGYVQYTYRQEPVIKEYRPKF